MRYFYLIILMCLLPSVSYAVFWESEGEGDFSLMVAISNDSPVVGDQVTIQVTASAPAAYSIDEGVLREQIMNHFNIVSQRFSFIDSSVSPQKVLYTVVPKVPGEFFVNLLTVPLVSETLPTKYIAGKVFLMNVRTPLTTSQDALSWAQSVMLPRNQWSLFVSSENREKYMDGPEELSRQAYRNRKIFEDRYFPLYTIFFSTVFGILFYLVRNQLLSLIRSILTTPRNVRNEVLLAVKTLRPEDDSCYERLSGILREYVEEKHQIKATTKTTGELLTTLKADLPFPVEKIEQLNVILKEADLVKFADKDSSIEERKDTLLSAKHFIKTT